MNAAPLIDWAKEAQIAAVSRIRQDTDVMPSPHVPEASRFRWDYARTHRLESSALGLNVNLSDRCSLLISLYLMAITGGCKIGEMPAHEDLFMHMKDASESGAPAGR